MPESIESCFELSIHFPVFFSRELFLVAVHGWFAKQGAHTNYVTVCILSLLRQCMGISKILVLSY